MLFEEMREEEQKVLKDGADTTRYYQLAEAYFVAKFIDNICFGDKDTIERFLNRFEVQSYVQSAGVLSDDLDKELFESYGIKCFDGLVR